MLISLVGKRFGRLEVISRGDNSKGGEARWICKCDCGNITAPIRGSCLRGGITKSCGCLHKEISAKLGQNRPPRPFASHHESCTRLYSVWHGIKSRCKHPSNTAYKNYGGRGISVCPEWESSYEAFRAWAMKTGYDPDAARGKCTIDRIDVDGDYCPENCRWITVAEQNRNKRKQRVTN